MNIKQPSNSASPASPSTRTENSVDQFAFFKIEENDPEPFKSNKMKIIKLMKMLQKKGLLASASIKDYEINGSFVGGQGVVHRVVEKKEYHSHLNPDGRTYFGGKYLALKVEDLFLTNTDCSLQFKPRELELMTDKLHKSVIQAEKVFFEDDHVNAKYTVNIVMPWYKYTLVSWLLKKNGNQGHFSEIKNNKRRFEEVRRVLRAVLKGISAIHLEDYVHMDIKPENIFIDEYYNDISEEIDEEDCKPVLISQPIIGDFGLAKDTTNSSTNIGYTEEYAAPELIGKKRIISSKADIFSFGKILYKIFISEVHAAANNRDSDELFKINKENVTKRIEILFPKDKDTISESMIEDITEIINISLEENIKLRPHGINLLQEHEFFKLSQKELSKVSDFEIENTFEYGLKLLEGKNGYPKDLKKAREIFQKLSNSFNHMPSKYFFGFMVCWGLGGNEDKKRGRELMQQSAPTSRNYFETHCDSLGFSEFAIGHALENDPKAAESFFQKSSKKGNSFAQKMLGLIHENGWGVEKNVSLAFDFYMKSALNGNCIAQDGLGLFFGTGSGPTKQDYHEAFKWFKLSSDQGYPSAQGNFGLHFDNGWGVFPDKGKAVACFRLGAENGCAHAQFLFAGRLEHGDGVAKDLKAAIAWLEKAAEQGHAGAITALQRLKTGLGN